MPEALVNAGVTHFGIAGLALLLIGWLMYVVLNRQIPALTAAWSEQIEAERNKCSEESAADRQMFKEAFAVIHTRLDRIEDKIDRNGSAQRSQQCREKQ